jgi:hypothetical protein
MTPDDKAVERRQHNPSRSLRAKRLVGGSAGTMIAVIVAWGYAETYGKPMPGEVSAAIGGLLTTFLVCLDDIIALWFNRRSQ